MVKTLREVSWKSHYGGEHRRTDRHRPSGRLGGPGVPTLRGDHPIPHGAGMESYSAALPFDEALNRLRRVLSRSGFEILRECDVGVRVRSRSGSHSAPQCRMLYVTDPELFATAISIHASAALWLPIPLVVCEREESVAIMAPAELIVRDRAALLGLRSMVEELYQVLRAAVETVSTRDFTAGELG